MLPLHDSVPCYAVYCTPTVTTAYRRDTVVYRDTGCSHTYHYMLLLHDTVPLHDTITPLHVHVLLSTAYHGIQGYWGYGEYSVVW